MSTHDTITVGSVAINLPHPEGYQRYNGRNSAIDAAEQSLLPLDNRLLATSVPNQIWPQLLVPGTYPTAVCLQVQTAKSFEGFSISNSDFDSQITPETQWDSACHGEFEKNQDLAE